MLVTRVINNKIQEYEYKGKDIRLDSQLQLRIDSKRKEKLFELAEEKGYKNTSSYMLDIIDREIKANETLD